MRFLGGGRWDGWALTRRERRIDFERLRQRVRACVSYLVTIQVEHRERRIDFECVGQCARACLSYLVITQEERRERRIDFERLRQRACAYVSYLVIQDEPRERRILGEGFCQYASFPIAYLLTTQIEFDQRGIIPLQTDDGFIEFGVCVAYLF